MNLLLNLVRKNPTMIYTAIATALPLVATFGIDFDQDKVLGMVSAGIALVVGGAVRQSSVKATKNARQEVPEGYVLQSAVFPEVDFEYPATDMSSVDRAEGVQ